MTRSEFCSTRVDESKSDLEGELGEEDISEYDLWLFGQTLGIDTRIDKDLAWIVQEAFTSPVPQGWNVDFSSEGKAFYFSGENYEATWIHPTDMIYRETLQVIKTLRAEPVPTDPEHCPTSHRMVEAIDHHLQAMTQDAVAVLDHWTGPHYVEDEAEDVTVPYFYNTQTGKSAWRDPIEDLESELHLQYSLLCRSLLPGISEKHVTEAKKTTSHCAPSAMSQSPRIFHTPRSCAGTPLYSHQQKNSYQKSEQDWYFVSPLRCEPLTSPYYSSIMARRRPMEAGLICA